jgi:hypothetical protein
MRRQNLRKPEFGNIITELVCLTLPPNAKFNEGSNIDLLNEVLSRNTVTKHLDQAGGKEAGITDYTLPQKGKITLIRNGGYETTISFNYE